ncbi:MAG: hypothetical protein LUG16_00505 [Candidatus Gastranaerophilales bacterium]|nr:hypothetical protein [Candidatus Gastranaerophilales bacterium]
MNFLYFAYTFIILLGIIEKNYIVTSIAVLTMPFVIFYFNNEKVKSIINYKRQITRAQKKLAKNKTFEPFIDINKEPWYILELIPGIRRPIAKKLANQVRQKQIHTFVEYANFTGLDLPFYEINKRIIKF